MNSCENVERRRYDVALETEKSLNEAKERIKELEENAAGAKEATKKALNDNVKKTLDYLGVTLPKKVAEVVDEMVPAKVAEAMGEYRGSPTKPRPGKTPSKPFLTRSDTVDAELPDQ